MENVKFTRSGSKLTIEVDLAHRGKCTEKTQRIASTEGNVALDDMPEVKVGLNIYCPLPKAAPAAK
jgi:hypothetical protein